MVLQYSVVALQNDVWTCDRRADFQRNLKHVAESIRIAVATCAIDLPVRLVALAEGGLGGWGGARGKGANIKVYNELAIEIPGEETAFLGEICKELDTYLIAQAWAKDDELMKERVFNIAFIINPKGEIIHKHRKTAFFTREYMTAPHDIWDRYVELYGDDAVKLAEAIWPVARTEIGNIGTLICAEGSFPEAARALALNGAEIIWRASYVEPWVGNKMFEIQNRSHAIFNTCYVMSPIPGDVYGRYLTSPDHKSSFGTSQIIDYRGNIISEYVGTGEAYVSAIINIDGLRDFRIRGLWQNLVKSLRVEEYKVIYDAIMAKGGIYPRNLCMEEFAPEAEERPELERYLVNRMVDLGIYTPPPGTKPYTISKGTLERVRKASRRA